MDQNVAGSFVYEGQIEAMKEWKAGKIGTAMKLHLFKAGYSPPVDATAADLATHECDFDDYTPAAITWGSVGLSSDGRATMVSDDVFMVVATNANPDTVGGGWLEITTAAGPPAVVVAMLVFTADPPVPMNALNLFINLTVFLTLPGQVCNVIISN